MAYYTVCPDCGANLDPGESCDCNQEKEKAQAFYNKYLNIEKQSRQLVLTFSNGGIDYENEKQNYG